jgi:two-component system phosphate regulon sensor histidine kinase PhoR
MSASGLEFRTGAQTSDDSVILRVLNSTRDAAVIVDREMRVFVANEAANETFGLEGDKIKGRKLSETIRDAGLNDRFLSALERGESSEIKFDLTGRVSAVYNVHISPIEVHSVRMAIGFFYNVTKVERLERIRQEFLSNISHELRTPLTSILAFVETLEDGAIDDAEHNRRFLAVIKRNAERMRCLISDILELSMIESGRVAIEPASVELSSLVNAVFGDLSTKAKARDIKLINDVPADVLINVDPVRLEQMLTNLIDNAVKFDHDGGTVTVSYRRIGNKQHIYVADTGEGILPQHLDRIFERFYRADRARTSGAGGTGLGLAIVKHLARLHGGEISVTSELGKGSVFSIDLPSSLA